MLSLIILLLFPRLLVEVVEVHLEVLDIYALQFLELGVDEHVLAPQPSHCPLPPESASLSCEKSGSAPESQRMHAVCVVQVLHHGLTAQCHGSQEEDQGVGEEPRHQGNQQLN